MKRIIFISIVLSLVASAAMGQAQTFKQQGGGNNPPPPPILEDLGPTNYYPNASGIIIRSGYTYQYRNYKFVNIYDPTVLELYNAANPYLDVEWGHKDGTPSSPEDLLGHAPNSELFDSNLTIKQTYDIVDRLFTTQQKTDLKGKSMMIFLKIDSSTGKIADVTFSFRRDSPFMTIPVETYRSIELALKQNLIFTVTARGRKMNYLQLFWSQEF